VDGDYEGIRSGQCEKADDEINFGDGGKIGEDGDDGFENSKGIPMRCSGESVTRSIMRTRTVGPRWCKEADATFEGW
jgi:hypothetical protein